MRIIKFWLRLCSSITSPGKVGEKARWSHGVILKREMVESVARRDIKITNETIYHCYSYWNVCQISCEHLRSLLIILPPPRCPLPHIASPLQLQDLLFLVPKKITWVILCWIDKVMHDVSLEWVPCSQIHHKNCIGPLEKSQCLGYLTDLVHIH